MTYARYAAGCIKLHTEMLDRALIGKTVRVRNGSRHNGQPFGRSKKTWAGEVHKVVGVGTMNIGDPGSNQCGVTLCLEGHPYECFIPIEEVEFV